MTIENDFLPLAVSGTPNVAPQATYAASPLAGAGFQSGIVPSAILNKALRQSSLMSNIIAQFIIQQLATPVIDDGTTATILNNFTAAIQTLVNGLGEAATVNTTGGAVTLTQAQYELPFIIVTGALTSNSTINFPAMVGKWTLINSTTGGFTVTATTSGGTGFAVTQGGADALIGDGTNIRLNQLDGVTQAFGTNNATLATTAFVQQAVQEIGGYYLDSGTTNAYVVTLNPPIVSYPASLSLKIKIANPNTGASTLNAGAGAIPLVREDGSPVQQGDVFGLLDVQYDQTTNKFWMIGLAKSQLSACAFLNVGNGLIGTGGNLAVNPLDASLRVTGSGVGVSKVVTYISGNATLLPSQNMGCFVVQSAATLTVPRLNTTFNGWSFEVNALATTTIQPNATDSIQGGSAGGSYSMTFNSSAEFIGDGNASGNLNVVFQTAPQGQALAPQYLNNNITVLPGLYTADTSATNGGSAGQFTVTFPASPVNGTIVAIDDFAGTFGQNPLLINPNGATICGFTTTSFVVDVQGASVQFEFKNGNWSPK